LSLQGTPVIKAVGLTKTFRDFWQRARVRAVNDLDFTVHAGEIFGLLGPNGSGKSTTIKMVLGLLHPSRGRVSVFGRAPDDVRIKNRIGYLPEESYLYRFLNAREILDYYGTLFQIHRRERLRRIEGLLEMVGLKGAARRPVGEYSKGMARRIGLAQALINDPDLLILDEPTSGLDPIGSKLVKDIIVRLGEEKRKTILLSSHLLADVEEVCDRVTILYGGKIRVEGAIQEVLQRQDRTRIDSDRLSPETLRAIEDLVWEREQCRIEVTHPSDRLESLFVRIVEDAHAERLETHGSQKAGEIAGFLGEQAATDAVLSSLLKPEREEKPAAAAPPAEPPVEEDVLDSLTASERQRREAPAEDEPRGDLDRDVLDDLLRDDRKGGQ